MQHGSAAGGRRGSAAGRQAGRGGAGRAGEGGPTMGDVMTGSGAGPSSVGNGAPAAALSFPGRLTAEASLADHVRLFFHEPVLRIMAVVPVIAVGIRVAMGNWRLADLAVLALLFVIFPFAEWGIHVFVLHAKPKRLFGRTVELGATRNHRDHHARPTDPSMSVAESARNMVEFSVGILILAGVVLRDVPLVLTVFAFAWAGVLAYEWSHYLIHSAWHPQSTWFAKRRHLHLLHHYRSEHHWFGVVGHGADLVFRTAPKPRTVPRSPTARDLGAEAARVLGPSADLRDDTHPH